MSPARAVDGAEARLMDPRLGASVTLVPSVSVTERTHSKLVLKLCYKVGECVQQFHSPDCNRLYEITKALIHVNTLRPLAFQGKCLSVPEKRCLKDLNTCTTKFLLPNFSCWWGIPSVESMLYQGPPSWRTSVLEHNPVLKDRHHVQPSPGLGQPNRNYPVLRSLTAQNQCSTP